jgi:hypothetical protein
MKTLSDPLKTLHTLAKRFEIPFIYLYDHFRSLFETHTALSSAIVFSFVEMNRPKALRFICSVMFLYHNFENKMQTLPDDIIINEHFFRGN